jgi:hypothetical protein
MWQTSENVSEFGGIYQHRLTKSAAVEANITLEAVTLPG